MFDDRTILITGGTGSLGRRVASLLLAEHTPRKVIVFSRDEWKQSEMQRELEHASLRFFLGDVRDKDRLARAFAGVDYVIHAAALKQVPAAEYNPTEAIHTNIYGAENVINAAIDCGVARVVSLSTDKAANPINLYGATKLCSDKLMVAANSLAGGRGTRFSVVRYGNVLGSRGSVLELFAKQRTSGRLTITDLRMTRFWITVDQAARFVLRAFSRMRGGETLVPKLPSMKVADLARAVAPECEIEPIGIRPGEKLHEVMIGEDDARMTLELPDHYVVQPAFPWWERARKFGLSGGRPVAEGFRYASDTNPWWLSPEELRQLIGVGESAESWAVDHGVLPLVAASHRWTHIPLPRIHDPEIITQDPACTSR